MRFMIGEGHSEQPMEQSIGKYRCPICRSDGIDNFDVLAIGSEGIEDPIEGILMWCEFGHITWIDQNGEYILLRNVREDPFISE